MAEFDYDLFVIGAGSGGVRASRMAASHGARVAVAEDRYLGGTCVNVGCIPKKLLSYGSHFSADFADARSYGWSLEPPTFDWGTLIANKDKEIQRLNGIYERLLGNAGVEIIDGRAKLVDAHTVAVNGRQMTAKYILVATGSWPVVPGFPGNEYVITSNEAFYLESMPERVVVVGGGYIAVEFAGIFHGLGAQTTQLYRGPLFLRGFDGDVRQHLADEMTAAGVDLRFNANITKIDKADDGLLATLEDGSTLAADAILYATGRTPMTAGLGLENAGVETDAGGAVIVDEYFQTSAASVYALGDVIDRMQLTPVAIAEAMALTMGLFGGEPTSMDYSDIATAVFSHPNIGTVGLSEEEAREKHASVDIYRSSFRQLKLTLTERTEKTLMKLVVDRESDRVLGVHMVGPDAGEVIQGLAVALRAGATKADFDRTVGIHPTAAEEFVTMREPIS